MAGYSMCSPFIYCWTSLAKNLERMKRFDDYTVVETCWFYSRFLASEVWRKMSMSVPSHTEFFVFIGNCTFS